MNKEYLKKIFLDVLIELKNLKELKKLNELNELNKEIQKSRNIKNVDELRELRSKLPKLKELIKENPIIYKNKEYKFKSEDDIIVYYNIYDDNINDSYDLAIKSPVTADNNNLYLDIYNEIKKNHIKNVINKEDEEYKEILQKMNDESFKLRDKTLSEVDKAQNLIDNIKEDDYKDFRILNALNNLFEVAKILIKLQIKSNNSNYILYNKKIYMFHYKSVDKYKSSIYKLKTSIDYIESGQTLEKKNAIYIISIFNVLSSESPNNLYDDVLKSVIDKVANAEMCKAYAAKEEVVVEYKDEKKEGEEEIKNLIEVAKILISLKIKNDKIKNDGDYDGDYDGDDDVDGDDDGESEKSESYILYNNIKYKFYYKENLEKYNSSINELNESIDYIDLLNSSINELNESIHYNDSGETFEKIRKIFGELKSPNYYPEHIYFTSPNNLYDDVLKSVKEKVNKEAFCKAYAAEEAAGQEGGKRKSKGNSKKVAKKPVVSQKKQSIYKEIFGKQMKIYKMPDSRKEYVKYKGELLHISDYKDLMKQKAKPKTKVTKVTQQKSKSKAKAKSKTKK